MGRFAPSPTGALHLGSLTTAVASYCHIKSLNGLWRLRIEDTDHQRCLAQHSRQILIDLEALGLHWDGDVIYQSERTDIYHDYLSKLNHLTYGCDCSRKVLRSHAKTHGTRASHYPRLCLHRSLNRQTHKVRLQLPNHLIGFVDGIQGAQWLNPQQTEGDMVVKRQNGIINYILAVSIDDGLQGITHVMRGVDILPMTTAQISIMQAARLPAIDHWYHLPLLHNVSGQKLSKQNLAAPIDSTRPSELLATALTLLKQPKVALDTPERMLQQAISQWDMDKLHGQRSLGSVPDSLSSLNG